MLIFNLRHEAIRNAMSTSTVRRTPKARREDLQPDAITLLKADHEYVDELFKSFGKINGNSKKKTELVKDICAELRAHTTVEEEIFYPAVRAALKKEKMLVDEADVEHALAKQLISELEDMKAGDDHYDAKVIVLGEYIRHHVREEHTEMFPKVKKSTIDLHDLGGRIQQRKLELKNGMSTSILAALAMAPM
ncbi:MAG TPA: hemerythrin domain-containing protein [Burkholderiales bacterium]|nr:hemerythrin domain-containing protein [Burkholderiales bacterium]